MAAGTANPNLDFATAPAEAPPKCRALRLSDGYETAVYVYEPPGGPSRLPVVYLHGIQSHPGWFSGSAVWLAKAGHPVLQPVRRGSGANCRERGHAPSAAQLLDDVAAACDLAAETCQARRVHLLGVSWGGKLAACYARQPAGGVELASLTMVTPGIVPLVDVPAAVKLAIALSLLACPRRSFEIPLSDVALFTDNQQMRRYLLADRHRLTRATASFLWASRRLDRILRASPPVGLHQAATLILAQRDRIIDNGATLGLLRHLAAGRLEVRELPGCHTLEFEPDPQPLFRAVAEALASSEQRPVGTAAQ